MGLLRSTVKLLEALRAPISFRKSDEANLFVPVRDDDLIDTGYEPLCATCNRGLEAWGITNTQRTRVEILGKHHGAEHAAWFELGTETWDEEDVARAIRGYRWFPPEAPLK